MLEKQLKNPPTGNMFAWGYTSRQRLDSIRLGGGLRLQADGDSRRLALTSQKYTLKSMILKDTPSGLSNFNIQNYADPDERDENPILDPTSHHTYILFSNVSSCFKTS